MKRAAAERAVAEYVESGIVLGLGTGSTAAFVVRRVGELISRGELEAVRGVATSARTAARNLGVDPARGGPTPPKHRVGMQLDGCLFAQLPSAGMLR